MADALSKIQAGVDKARGALAKSRLGGREHEVTIAPRVEGDPLIGTGPSWGDAITLSPRPSVKLGVVRKFTEGAVQEIGDAKVTGISRAYTSEDLHGRWTIAGCYYSLAILEAQPTEWIAVLRREA